MLLLWLRRGGQQIPLVVRIIVLGLRCNYFASINILRCSFRRHSQTTICTRFERPYCSCERSRPWRRNPSVHQSTARTGYPELSRPHQHRITPGSLQPPCRACSADPVHQMPPMSSIPPVSRLSIRVTPSGILNPISLVKPRLAM